MESDWVEIRNCTWMQEAHFVKSVLKAEGIEALIPDQYLLGVQPLRANAIEGARVLVRAVDRARAAEVLDALSDPLGAATDDAPDAIGG
jgi:hypothetical protein